MGAGGLGPFFRRRSKLKPSLFEFLKKTVVVEKTVHRTLEVNVSLDNEGRRALINQAQLVRILRKQSEVVALKGKVRG